MDDTDVVTLLELQYAAIEELHDGLGRLPTREETVEYLEGLMDGPKFMGLRLVPPMKEEA